MSLYDELLGSNEEDPRCYGVLTGIVKENHHEDYPGRVKVEFHIGEEGKNETGWVRVASPYAGNAHGAYLHPEVGTEVVIAFENGDGDSPIVIGSLWGTENAIPDNAVTEKNTVKLIKSKGGHEISFHEEEDKGRLQIVTPGKMKIMLEDEKKTITIMDAEGENKIAMDGENGQIQLSAKKKITLSIGGTAVLSLDGDGKKVEVKMDSVNLEASQTLNIKGQGIKLKGGQLEVKADGVMKLESGAMAEIKGSMVKIN